MVHIKVHPRPDPIGEFSTQLDKMIGDMQSRVFHKFSSRQGWAPAINLYETRTTFLVCVDLAGMDAERIDVYSERSLLRISGYRSNPAPPAETEELCVHLMEIDAGQFAREVEVPEDVDPEAIQATYCKGFLWVTLPKRGGAER